MRIAGIDYSSRYVDLVTVPYDGPGQPMWHRFPLTGADAFDRARSVADSLPGRASVLWDDVLAVGIENPGARHPGVNTLWRMQGAILARIPARMLVEPLPPGKWRKLVGVPGNASKETVALISFQLGSRWPSAAAAWPQDAHDAHLIALATRTLIDTKQAA